MSSNCHSGVPTLQQIHIWLVHYIEQENDLIYTFKTFNWQALLPLKSTYARKLHQRWPIAICTYSYKSLEQEESSAFV